MAVNPESYCRTSKVATRSTAWYLNYPWNSPLIKGRHNGRLILAAAKSIVSTILLITSAEPAFFGVNAVDLLSRWRALRGFRKTLEDDHD